MLPIVLQKDAALVQPAKSKWFQVAVASFTRHGIGPERREFGIAIKVCGEFKGIIDTNGAVVTPSFIKGYHVNGEYGAFEFTVQPEQAALVHPSTPEKVREPVGAEYQDAIAGA